MRKHIAKSAINTTLTSAFFIVMLIFSRGMILGNIALRISFIAALFCILLSVYYRKPKRTFGIYISCISFYAYCFLQGLLLNSTSRYHSVIEFCLYWTINATAAYFVFSNKETDRKIGRLLIIILIAFVASYIITFFLSVVISIDKLKLMDLDYNYFYKSPVYFPFTIVYGIGEIGPIAIPRMQGFCRECGITQTFYIWAFYKCDDYYRQTKFIKVALAAGVLFCFSTTGIAIFLTTILLNVIISNRKEIRKNWKLILIMLILLYLVLRYGGTFSLSNRLSVSYIDRTANIISGMKELSRSPLFGVGFMNNPLVKNDLSDICLLASIGKIGIIGFSLFILVYIICLVNHKNRRLFLFSNAGFFITALLAQPLYYTPLIYVFLFMNYDGANNKQLLHFGEVRK